MAIKKEHQGPRPMEKLAKILHTEVNKGEIVIPADKGKGFIKGMRPNEHMGISHKRGMFLLTFSFSLRTVFPRQWKAWKNLPCKFPR